MQLVPRITGISRANKQLQFHGFTFLVYGKKSSSKTIRNAIVDNVVDIFYLSSKGAPQELRLCLTGANS